MHASFKLLLLLFTLFFNSTIYSQNGELCLTIVPANSFVKISGNLVDLSKVGMPHCISLPVGKHKVEVWSEGFEIHEKEIEVKANDKTNLNMGLNQLSPAYEIYQDELTKYHKTRLKRNLEMGFLSVVDIGITIYAVNVYRGKKIKDSETALELAEKGYESAISVEELAERRFIYQEARTKYNDEIPKHNRRLAVATTSILAAYGLTYWAIQKQKKNKPKKPVFNSVNPLVNISAPTGALQGNTCQFGISINF